MTYACCNFDTKIDHCVSRAKVERLLFNDLQIKSKLTVNSFELNCNARGHNKKYFCWMKLLYQLSVAQKSSFIIQECNRRQQDARSPHGTFWKSDLKKKLGTYLCIGYFASDQTSTKNLKKIILQAPYSLRVFIFTRNFIDLSHNES